MFTREALVRFHAVIDKCMDKIQDPTLDPRVRANYAKVAARAQKKVMER